MRTRFCIPLILALILFVCYVHTPSATRAATSVSPCPGDVNGDGVVNVFDLVAVATRYGALATPYTPEDANGDGHVDLLDLVLVAANYGCVTLGPATIPTATATVTQTPTRTPTARPGECWVYVTRVIDGDTIEVQMNGSVYPVRYIGMDTPELPHECYAREATDKNCELVLHKTVRLEKDVRETDHYGRMLRYVYVGDTFVNAELVRLGYAMVYTVPPDVKYADYFLQLQQEARDARRGLWSACAWPPTPSPTAPSEPQPACDCSYNRYNCSDFDTQAAAQACYDYCLTTVGFDVHRLDGDHDGIACESNP